MNKLSNNVIVTPEGEEIPSKEVLEDERHLLLARVDVENRDINLNFSSREAMYEFAKSLLQEAVFGTGGQIEFYPLITDKKLLIVNGVRLAEDSSRIFVTYHDGKEDSLT